MKKNFIRVAKKKFDPIAIFRRMHFKNTKTGLIIKKSPKYAVRNVKPQYFPSLLSIHPTD